MFVQFLDPFLQTLGQDVLASIEERRARWNISPDEFYSKLDAWFSNFNERDKNLALKILMNIQYFNERDFENKIRHTWLGVERYLAETNTPKSRVVLVAPDERGDSADRHAYIASKALGLPKTQINTVSSLDRIEKSKTVLLFLNDTHGTGTQFIREFRDATDFDHFQSVFILGAVFSKKALGRFRAEMRGVIIPNASPSKSADLILTGEEWERVKRLGSQVYPKHPLGFGDAALLVAYHFQCPNNTLPLIWADGENNASGGSGYPWRPLFPYRPKPKGPVAKIPPGETKTPSLLDFSKLSFELSDSEKSEVTARAIDLGSSKLSKKQNVINWLNNFKAEEKNLALKILDRHKHCDLSTTRHFIRDLGHRVSAELAPFGSDIGDVLLVTTGTEQESTYHYVFEFMREWRLEFRQVIDIEQLNANSALDRHLVFFYHTRPPGREFFVAKDALGGKSYFDLVKEAKPISTLICSFAEAPGFDSIFERESGGDTIFSRVSIPEASRSIDFNLGEDTDDYSELISGLFGSHRYPPKEHLLVSYYFKIPEITSPFIWFAGKADDGRAWVPLLTD